MAGSITHALVADGTPLVADTDWNDQHDFSGLSLEGHDHDGSPESKLAQANTHESPDTDSSTSSLHHTIGTGANQAAAGNHTHAGSGVPSGTSFPGSPSTNDLYFRTDRGLLYFYDGTRWLTVAEYSESLGNLDTNQPLSVNGSLKWGATDLGDNGQWITRIAAVNFVATTNNGSNFWTLQLTSRSATATAHNLGSTWSTAADTNDQFVKHVTTVGAAVTSGDTHFVITGTKTSSPGNIYTMATVYYRLIG